MFFFLVSMRWMASGRQHLPLCMTRVGCTTTSYERVDATVRQMYLVIVHRPLWRALGEQHVCRATAAAAVASFTEHLCL